MSKENYKSPYKEVNLNAAQATRPGKRRKPDPPINVPTYKDCKRNQRKGYKGKSPSVGKRGTPFSGRGFRHSTDSGSNRFGSTVR